MIILHPIYKNEFSDGLSDQLAVFLEGGFPTDSKGLWILRFNLWWFSNPAMTDDIPAGWILRNTESGEILGFRGNIPVKYQYNDTILLGSASTAWYVVKEYRREYSTKIFNEQLLQKNMDLFIATTPAPPVLMRMLKTGFKIIDPEIPTTIYPVLTNWHLFASQLSKKFSREAILKHGLAKKRVQLVSLIFGVASAVLPKPKNSSLPEQIFDSNYKIEVCVDVATFISYVSLHARTNSIEISKDMTTLKWLLFSPQVQILLSRKVNLLFDSLCEYCGYFIYDFQTMYGEKTLRIRDLQLLRYDGRILNLILKHLKIVARNNLCSGVFVTLLHPDSQIVALLNKRLKIKLQSESRYCVMFQSKILNEVDAYSRYVPSDLDPDGGVI